MFENIYEGLKTGNSFLNLIVFLLESLIDKNPTKTVAYIIKYNILFLLLENITDIKIFDFLLNFISPMSKIYDFN